MGYNQHVVSCGRERERGRSGEKISGQEAASTAKVHLRGAKEESASRCCAAEASLTGVLAVRQDVFGHLVAAAHVVLVRFGNGQLADWDQRSAVEMEGKFF